MAKPSMKAMSKGRKTKKGPPPKAPKAKKPPAAKKAPAPMMPMIPGKMPMM